MAGCPDVRDPGDVCVPSDGGELGARWARAEGRNRKIWKSSSAAHNGEEEW